MFKQFSKVIMNSLKFRPFSFLLLETDPMQQSGLPLHLAFCLFCLQKSEGSGLVGLRHQNYVTFIVVFIELTFL